MNLYLQKQFPTVSTKTIPNSHSFMCYDTHFSATICFPIWATTKPKHVQHVHYNHSTCNYTQQIQFSM